MLTRLFKPRGRSATEHEVERELRFHIESLVQEYTRRGMTAREAEDAAHKRFGDVGRVKIECVAIRRRSRRVTRVFKSLLTLVLLAGVLVRVSGADFHVGKVGEILIAVAVLGRLLLHARNLRPSDVPSEKRNILAGGGY